MSAVRTIRLVAAREVRERLRAKSFRNSTLISLVFILAVAIIPGLIADDDDATVYDVGLAGEVPAGFDVALAEVAGGFGDVSVETSTVSEEEGRTLVEDGDLDAVVLGATTVVVDDDLESELGAIISTAQRQTATAGVLESAGVTGDDAATVLSPEPLAVEALDPPDEDQDQRSGVAFVGTILLFGQIFGFGFWVASGVVEEKTSRIMEVLMAKVSPTRQLTGKVVGIGVVGMAQLLVFAAVGLGAATASGTIDLPAEIAPIGGVVLGWFLLGFALYACLFAMGGALASRTEELQSTTGPITFIAMISYFGAIFAASSPDTLLARVVALFPTSSPLAMPGRIATGDAALWEVGAAVAILLAAVAVLLPLAARVHAGAALVTRGRLKFGQALKRAAQ